MQKRKLNAHSHIHTRIGSACVRRWRQNVMKRKTMRRQRPKTSQRTIREVIRFAHKKINSNKYESIIFFSCWQCSRYISLSLSFLGLRQNSSLIASFVCDWLLLIHCQSRSVMPNHDCINDGNNNNMYLCANMFGKLSLSLCVPWWLWSKRAFAISHSDSASIWNGLINMYESKIQLIGKCVFMNAARESMSVRKIGNVISIIPYMISFNVLLNSTWRILAHTHYHYLHVVRKPFEESISILHSFFILWIDSLDSFSIFLIVSFIHEYSPNCLREYRIKRIFCSHFSHSAIHRYPQTQCVIGYFFSSNEQLVQCTQWCGYGSDICRSALQK